MRTHTWFKGVCAGPARAEPWVQRGLLKTRKPLRVRVALRIVSSPTRKLVVSQARALAAPDTNGSPSACAPRPLPLMMAVQLVCAEAEGEALDSALMHYAAYEAEMARWSDEAPLDEQLGSSDDDGY